MAHFVQFPSMVMLGELYPAGSVSLVAELYPDSLFSSWELLNTALVPIRAAMRQSGMGVGHQWGSLSWHGEVELLM